MIADRRWIGALTLLLACCAGSDRNREARSRRSPRDEERYRLAVQRRELKLGMNEREVLQVLGKPSKKETTKYYRKRVIGWVYPSLYVYFDRGYVIRVDAPGY